MSKPNGVVYALILFLLVFTSGSVFSPKPMVLGSPVQVRRFKRPDPLCHFRNYNGSYDIANKHYWASAVFTGVHGYAIAGVWLIGGLGFGIFVTCKKLRSKSSRPVEDYTHKFYVFMFLLVILFTFVALAATGVALAANESSLHRTERFEGDIIKAGQSTRQALYKVVKVMIEMQHLLLPYDPVTSLQFYKISDVLKRQSTKIENFVKKSGDSIDLAIQTSHTLHLAVVTINLVFLAASLVMLLLHWHPGFIIIFFVCWILTSVCWALEGFDFFLFNFAKDTCTAIQDFEQNPQNSSLSSIMPCMDPSKADKILKEIGRSIHNFISELNSKIRKLSLLVASDRKRSNSLALPEICSPFSGPPNYTYVPENCSKDSIPIGDLPNILSNFTCYKENSSNTCRSQGKFIPETFLNMTWAYSHSIQNMINIFPDLVILTKCKIVHMTFTDILKYQCRPLRFSIRLLWSSMLSLSILMVVLVLTWVAKVYQERSRHFSKCSIIPDPR